MCLYFLYLGGRHRLRPSVPEEQTVSDLFAVIRESELSNISRDDQFGKKLADACDSYIRTDEPQQIYTSTSIDEPAHGISGRRFRARPSVSVSIVGRDHASENQIYVIHEGGVDRVTRSSGLPRAIEALASILRAHGYDVIRRGK